MPLISNVLQRLQGTKFRARVQSHGLAPHPVTEADLSDYFAELNAAPNVLKDIREMGLILPDNGAEVSRLAQILVAFRVLSNKNAELAVRSDDTMEIVARPAAVVCHNSDCLQKTRAGQKQGSNDSCCESLRRDLGPLFMAEVKALAALQRADLGGANATMFVFVNPGSLAVFASSQRV